MKKSTYATLVILGASLLNPETSHNQLVLTDCGLILVHSKEYPKRGVFTKHYVAEDELGIVKEEIFNGSRERILRENSWISPDSLEASFERARNRGVVVRVLFDELAGVEVVLEYNGLIYDIKGNPKDYKASVRFSRSDPYEELNNENPFAQNSLKLAQRVLDEARNGF